MMKSKFWPSIFFAVVFALVLIGTAGAQDPTPTRSPVTDDDVNAIAKQMYCPVCENTPLDVCPTQACAEWRELIRDKLAEGWSDKQIKTYFVERFGDRVLAAPPARGLNWLVYVIPPLGFLAGAFLLYRAFKSWRTPEAVQTSTVEAQNSPANDPYVELLEEELRKL
jgi:cytochrome c-type biogenesis protein CcmH